MVITSHLPVSMGKCLFGRCLRKWWLKGRWKMINYFVRVWGRGGGGGKGRHFFLSKTNFCIANTSEKTNCLMGAIGKIKQVISTTVCIIILLFHVKQNSCTLLSTNYKFMYNCEKKVNTLENCPIPPPYRFYFVSYKDKPWDWADNLWFGVESEGQ